LETRRSEVTAAITNLLSAPGSEEVFFRLESTGFRPRLLGVALLSDGAQFDKLTAGHAGRDSGADSIVASVADFIWKRYVHHRAMPIALL
jgi:hypothetical protein